MYFLDSNTCIHYLNGRSESIRNRILITPPIEVAIPSIVKAELLLGAFKSKSRSTTLEKLEKFLDPFEIVPFDDQTAYHYAEIRSTLESAGEIIGPNDLLIASIAIFHDAILVTSNVSEFSRVSGLRIEDWMEDNGTSVSI